MDIANAFRALNRYTCRKLLDHLQRGSQSVAELAARDKYFSRPSISQGLKLLLDAKLVTLERQGRRHYYQINQVAFQELARYATKFAKTRPARTKRIQP